MPRTERRPARLSWRRAVGERPEPLRAGALAAAAALVAAWPYTAVITPGAWSFAVIAVVIVVALVGVAARTLLRRRPSWARELVTMLLQIIAAGGALTALVAGDTALYGIFPTPTSVSLFGTLLSGAGEQIVFGSAPLDSTPGLRLALGGGFAIVAVLIDQLLAQRSAVLASVLVAVVGAVPMIVTVSGVDVAWFGVLGVTVLVLFRATARRHPEAPRRSSTTVALTVGAAAVAAAIVVAPMVPVSATLAGTGVGVTVDASLRLGDDLRQPHPVEVLTLATAGDAAPYLRLTTLSHFNGRIWQPDRGDLQSVSEGFGPADWGEDVTVKDVQTSIRILRMSSSWLPVPYPATEVSGVGTAWRVMPENRTVVSRSADAVGNDYTVASTRITPSLEQIRAASAAPVTVDPDEEPVELPEIIGATAAEVTADAESDYDRLIALQSWFRSAFTYSLETPVEEDFDGTGADAVARFLEVRSGYCVHFAGAFALMAQSMDMETRIVVGYLPGTRTQEKRGEETVFSVTSDQLHSWPEVLFPGIGWVPFEPTASLGVPTAFTTSASVGGTTGGSASTAPSTAPETEASQAPEIERGDAGDNAGSGAEQRRLDSAPVALIAVGAVFVLLLPALIRAGVGALRRRRTRHGDPASAWSELRATLIDLQLPLSDADSVRARGAELVADRGVDPATMRRLTDAVEHAAYAREASSADVADALDEVLRQVRRSVDGRRRVQARLLPLSLVVARASDVPVRA